MRFTSSAILLQWPITTLRMPRRSIGPTMERTKICACQLEPRVSTCLDRRQLLHRFFSSTSTPWEEDQASRSTAATTPAEPKRKRKPPRSRPGATSLRQVALEAQKSKDSLRSPPGPSQAPSQTKGVRAYCVAEQFHMPTVVKILEAKEYQIDPYGTELYPQVVHIEFSGPSTRMQAGPHPGQQDNGDIFIFPSGTVVAWDVPEGFASVLVSHVLASAARNPHFDDMETEDLDYVEDTSKENSTVKGDTIVVGIKGPAKPPGEMGAASKDDMSNSGAGPASVEHVIRADGRVNAILAKIAFSSGLARSTKLAVLESLLSNYFESTRSIPTMLSRGSRLPFTRSFILRKTGQLLSVRAQLNLYSELTDSLPDLFWDSRYELGLEEYYDQICRALDVGIRIKVLNTKMDYAQEIASVLRERLSEKHGLTLEWMIIILITVEVAFEVLRLVKEKNTAETRTG